jgi:chorismate mutase
LETNGGGFEGVGEIGLKWLKKSKEENRIVNGTEVANATHVKLALEYDIDVLWIGARTTVNPFAGNWRIYKGLKNCIGKPC